MDSIASNFDRNGFFSPIRVLSDAQIFSYRSLLYDTLMGKLEDPLVSHRYVWQLHLLIPWLAELVQQPSILDAVEQVLGRNTAFEPRLESCLDIRYSAELYRASQVHKTSQYQSGLRLRIEVGLHHC